MGNDLLDDPRVTRHAESLARRGHEVVVICCKTERTPRYERCRNYEIVRVPLENRFLRARTGKAQRARHEPSPNWPRFGVGRMSLARRTVRLLVNLADEAFGFVKAGSVCNANVYVSNDLDTLLPAFICSLILDRNLVYDAHELWTDQLIGLYQESHGYPSWLLSLLNNMESRLVKYCDATLTVNEFIADEMQTRHGIRPDVILNVPRLSEHSPRYFPQKIKTVLYQGAYGPGRGLENLLRACRYLRRDVTVSLRGFGAYETELRQIAESEKITNCRFEGPVPQNHAIAAASRADVGVIPYVPLNLNNYYSSPNKLFDYIQAGLPVVASDVPYLRKVVTRYNIGFLFNAEDIKSIAHAINVATRPATLKRLKNNVEKIRPLFCWEMEEGKYLAIFERLSL